ncbi:MULTISPECIES: DUF3347 domain-containing protein [Chryseobacterium]|uniref:Mercury transporter n=1 Tax=Chryseobacterium aquaticum subsp. greenlandense TaxID=345663 RepID=A0A117KBQ2_9FLAO|nr:MULTISPECIES: DUF3347 domain-containing protein [Chryseobacterium]KNB61173.1 mercury transporter [Chryseobacterium sp. Hurlbut01]KUJ56369.1 mercury transporter [Chryseobacterium aquaticum subsp. greenlandense]
MKILSKIIGLITVFLISANSFAQIKNEKSATIKIFGNGNTCKNILEAAGNVKKVSSVRWNMDTKIAEISYDSSKTNMDEILTRIALAGFDNEKFLAPDDAYAKLDSSCRYKRDLKPVSKTSKANSTVKNNDEHSMMGHSQMDMSKKDMSQLEPVFKSYFSLKDAFIKSDAGLTSSNAKELLDAVASVDMSKLKSDEHSTWMNVMKDIEAGAKSITQIKDINKQREAFAKLSEKVYSLAKVTKLSSPVYYQHCPMFNKGEGANWLSMDSTIKNPYYGSQMISCGSTAETVYNK